MKTPPLLLALVILALIAVIAGAQGPQRSEGFPARAGLPPAPSAGGDEIAPPAPPGPAGAPPAATVAPAVSLGQPGLSFRYGQTFGVAEEPYPADGQHLNGPAGLFMDASNRLHVTEVDGHRLLRFTASGTNDLILGHAGLPWYDGDYLAAPRDAAVDASGNIWVVFHPTVKKFDPSGNPLLTIPAVNPWESGNDNTHFNDSWSVAFDAPGRLFVSDGGNHRIQVYDVSGGTPVYVLTIGVTGQPRSDNTGFNGPTRIAFDGSGRLYVMDSNNHRVQRCTKNAGPPETWTCTTFFGVTGVPGNDLSHLEHARGIAIRGSDLFIADGANNRVLKCNLSGTCTLFAGVTDEPGTDNAHFMWPEDVAVDSSGNVYVSDPVAHRVQKFNSSGTYIGTVGETLVPYVPDAVRLNKPWGIAVAPDGSIYVTENRGFRLVKMNAAGVQQWTVGQAGVYGSDNAHFGDWWAGIEGSPAVDAAGRIYVPDTANHRVQIFSASGAYSATFGSGPGTGNYEFYCPATLAISPVNGDIFVVDHCNHRVMVYNSHRVYKTQIGVAGEPGSDNTHFNLPYGVAVDASGNVYVADTENHRVQKCTPSGANYACSSFAGETGVFGDDFGHLHPLEVAVDRAGRLYVSDTWNNRIQVFDATGAYLTTVGGSWDSTSGGLRAPSGITVDGAGNLYVADSDNHRVQKFAPGYPGWQQANINGFGDRHTDAVSALEASAARCTPAHGRAKEASPGSGALPTDRPGASSSPTGQIPLWCLTLRPLALTSTSEPTTIPAAKSGARTAVPGRGWSPAASGIPTMPRSMPWPSSPMPSTQRPATGPAVLKSGGVPAGTPGVGIRSTPTGSASRQRPLRRTSSWTCTTATCTLAWPVWHRQLLPNCGVRATGRRGRRCSRTAWHPTTLVFLPSLNSRAPSTSACGTRPRGARSGGPPTG